MSVPRGLPLPYYFYESPDLDAVLEPDQLQHADPPTASSSSVQQELIPADSTWVESTPAHSSGIQPVDAPAGQLQETNEEDLSLDGLANMTQRDPDQMSNNSLTSCLGETQQQFEPAASSFSSLPPQRAQQQPQSVQFAAVHSQQRSQPPQQQSSTISSAFPAGPQQGQQAAKRRRTSDTGMSSVPNNLSLASTPAPLESVRPRSAMPGSLIVAAPPNAQQSQRSSTLSTASATAQPNAQQSQQSSNRLKKLFGPRPKRDQ
jgi:hypothetical protein